MADNEAIKIALDFAVERERHLQSSLGAADEDMAGMSDGVAHLSKLVSRRLGYETMTAFNAKLRPVHEALKKVTTLGNHAGRWGIWWSVKHAADVAESLQFLSDDEPHNADGQAIPGLLNIQQTGLVALRNAFADTRTSFGDLTLESIGSVTLGQIDEQLQAHRGEITVQQALAGTIITHASAYRGTFDV